MAKFIQKQKDGSEIIRWERNKNLTKEQKKEQWREAEKESKEGKVICISDLV